MFFQSSALRWLVLTAYISLVLYLCLLPASSFKTNDFLEKIFFDKWVHMMMHFGTWTLLVWRAKGIGELTQNRAKIFVSSIAAVLILGVFIEYLQQYVGRSSVDWYDVLANLTGAGLAWIFWIEFEHRWSVYLW